MLLLLFNKEKKIIFLNSSITFSGRFINISEKYSNMIDTSLKAAKCLL